MCAAASHGALPAGCGGGGAPPLPLLLRSPPHARPRVHAAAHAPPHPSPPPPPQAPAAYKRGSGRQGVEDFEGFDTLSRGGGGGGGYGNTARETAWLLSSVGGDDEYFDDYGDYEDLQLPDQWENMDPKFVNGRQVLVNLQIE